MKQNKIDYPYCTRVMETSEICDSVKSQDDVDDYYRRYGQASFIWHKSWNDAFKYVMYNIKMQKKQLREALIRYKDTETKLKLMDRLKKLEGTK
jgi:hypothetical protein